MELAAVAGLGAQAATVAQLLGYVLGLVSRINRAANVARQNKSECVHLARRVSVIGELLPRLQKRDPEVARALAGLRDTLNEAHNLVIACCSQRKRDAVREFFNASGHTERFREVNGRIDSHLILVPLLSHVSVTDRLEKLIQTGVPKTIAKSSSAPSRASGSRQRTEPRTTIKPNVRSSLRRAAEVDQFSAAEITIVSGDFTLVLSQDWSGTVYKRNLGQPGGQGGRVKRSNNKRGPRRMQHEDTFVCLCDWCVEEVDMFVCLCDWYVEEDDTSVCLYDWCAEEEEERTFVYGCDY